MLEAMIQEFLKRSVLGELEGFDFNSFFIEFQGFLHRKLALHGVLSFEDYLEQIGTYYNVSALDQFSYEGKHSGINVTLDQIKKAVFTSRYLAFNTMNKGSGEYSKLRDLLSELGERIPLAGASLFERVELFEKCIHASHSSGFVVGIDVDNLREFIEKLIWDRAFGMLTRNGLEEKVKLARKPFNLVFFDLNGLREANMMLGYSTVNDIVRSIFGNHHPEVFAIGRYFSGDEILILTYVGDLEEIKAYYVRRAQKHGFNVRSEFFFSRDSIEGFDGHGLR